jgi:hypothetical protein
MTTINIIVPEATTNLIINPSIETNTTGWTAIGGAALAQTSDEQRRGVYSLEVTPGVGVTDGVYYQIDGISANTNYSYSVDFKGANNIPYTIYLYDVGTGQPLGTPQEITGDGEWHRYSDTVQSSLGASVRLYIAKFNSPSVDPCYVDGAQLEQKSNVTTYCDGDQVGNNVTLPGSVPAYRWNGTPHESTSSRDAATTAGGRIIDMEALGTVYNIQIGGMEGGGFAPQFHNTQDLALLEGAQLQSVKVEPRIITIFIRTDASGSDMNPGNYIARDQLEKLLTQDRIAPLQPVIIEWSDTGHRIKAYYQDGLQARWNANDAPGGCAYEIFQLRLISYDPFWFEDGQAGYNLDLAQSDSPVGNVDFTYIREDGAWRQVQVDTSLAIEVITPDLVNPNVFWFGGSFTSIDGVAANYVAKYDRYNDTFTALGVGTNNTVYAIAVHPNGDIYIAGNFTQAGGVANNGIVKYTPSTGTYASLGTGLTAGGAILVRNVLIEPETGDVYAVGSFTQAGGAAATYIAKWDVSGSAWTTLGTPEGLSGTDARDIVRTLDDEYIVVGDFTGSNDGETSENIITWTGSAWEAFPVGLATAADGAEVASNGDVYIFGQFTDTDPSTSSTLNKITLWNGSQFAPLGDGTTGSIRQIALGRDGALYAIGAFSAIGDIENVDGFAIWNGTAWVNIDIEKEAILANALTVDVYNNVIFSDGTVDPTVEYSAITTVNNPGTSTAWPIIKLTGPGEFRWIENQTTGDRLYLDMALLEKEEVIFNLAPQRKSIESNFDINRLKNVLPGSNLSSFRLLPGDNTVATFAVDTTGDTKIEMYWDIRHSSADGGTA